MKLFIIVVSFACEIFGSKSTASNENNQKKYLNKSGVSSSKESDSMFSNKKSGFMNYIRQKKRRFLPLLRLDNNKEENESLIEN